MSDTGEPPSSAHDRPGPARRREHPSGRSDDQLLQAWRAGDEEALAELLRSYLPRIHAVCYRMMQSADEASDLAHDALTKVLEGLHTYDGRSQLSTWIIRVSMNCCLSHLRKLRLRRHGSIHDPAAKADRSLRREHDAVDRVEQDERRAAVGRGVARLDPEMRSIIVLRDVQGLEYQQIGEVLSVPVGTVKSRLFRARSALRELVEEELQWSSRSETDLGADTKSAAGAASSPDPSLDDRPSVDRQIDAAPSGRAGTTRQRRTAGESDTASPSARDD